ncbi:uncharacterized protein FPRO_15985 [Fusarium proliferatum ET1]|uniref:Uncharacterized protein n=1 Tax=Fusarium proliferatum (strain ET1) TaxID=1227346 RepID=A0A1L7WBD8_FUSPR|nr:uncharacterized protein FPRO_15985 [Fusarium proliferatum ET1]CZR49776.1 uncharacterized protein FPRO_15985 [Fusarium proliferatum ET1]
MLRSWWTRSCDRSLVVQDVIRDNPSPQAQRNRIRKLCGQNSLRKLSEVDHGQL